MNSTESGKSTRSSRSSENNGEAHAGHRERLRQRAKDGALAAFKPHEVIELLLFYALPRRDVNELAHRLDKRFGGVRGVLAASEQALRAEPGIGARAARLLACVGEVCRAYAQLDSEDRPALGTPETFRAFCMKLRFWIEGEQTWLFCVNQEGRLLLAGPVTTSAGWARPEHVRAALADALSSHGSGALIARFVQRESPEPAACDRECARTYARAFAEVEIPLQECLMVAAQGAYSLRADISRFIRVETQLRAVSESPTGTPKTRPAPDA